MAPPNQPQTVTMTASYADDLARFRYTLEEGRAPLTVKTHLKSAELFLRWLEHTMGLVIPLSSVTKEHAREWLRFMREAGRKPASVRSRYAGARLMFKVALEDGEVTHNPFEGLTLPVTELTEPTILTEQDVQAMVDAAKRDKVGFLWAKRDVAILLVLYDTGVRASELLNIRERDIDWQRGSVLIQGKGSRERHVGLGAMAMRALNRYMVARKKYAVGRRAWWQQQPEDSPIWISRKSGRLTPSGLRTALERRQREGGVEKHVHAHAFRHSAATAMAGTAMPETELRAHFGWSANSPQVHRYTRSNVVQRAINRHRENAPGDRIRL